MDALTLLMFSTRAKSPTRQLGYSFKEWLQTIKYPFLEKEEFVNSNEVVFLKGSEEQLKQFVIKNLRIKKLKRSLYSDFDVSFWINFYRYRGKK